MKTLYLIDGHYLIFRSYYAPFSLLTAPSGEPVKATLTFTQTLLMLIREQKPDYLAMCMDVKDSTVRRAEVFAEYKTNRDRMPEDLPPQIVRIMEIVETLGIPIFAIEGFEADDVIASIAEKLRAEPREDIELRVVSRDKDLYQIIDDRVKLWDPIKNEVIDSVYLEAHCGFSPRESIDIQALTGDSIDNVPGIPGVGVKTAATLIRKYGSAEAVIAHIDELTPKLRENFRAHADRIPVNRELVTLNRSVPVEIDLEACRLKPLPIEKLRPIFEKLSFRRLLEQLDNLEATAVEGSLGAAEAGDDLEILAGVETPAGVAAAAAEPGPLQLEILAEAPRGNYGMIDTEAALEELVAKLSAAPFFALDTETPAFRGGDRELVGISFAWASGEAGYLPLASRRGRTLDRARALLRLAPLLANPSVRKIAHNVKLDRHALRWEGIELQGVEFDAMVASYLLRIEDKNHEIDTLAKEVLGLRMLPVADLTGKGKSRISMLDVDPRRLADRAAEDADITWRLHETLRPKLEASPMKALFTDVELPLATVLGDMEYEGIRIDCDLLRSISASMAERIDALEREIYRAAGREFCIDSPKQLGEVLFDEQKLRSVRKTKTSRSTDADVLETLSIETAHPLPRLILEYRELAKLKGTYVDPLPNLISPRTGRLHASFHQTVAATGRLSSSDPNIQNIPIRTEQGREIRKAFVARDPAHVLVTADYSQIELRILAHLSGDPALLEAFEKDADIHAFVAAQVSGVDIDSVDREARTKAKAVNFGIIYGQGPFGLAKSLGISQREASDFITEYKRKYKGVMRFIGECVTQAEQTGKVATLLGRQRAIPEIHSANRVRRALGERLAINTVVQGTAADMIKVAMVRIHERFRKEGIPAWILIQVHDELVIEAARDSAEGAAAVVQEEMAGALPLRVPVRVDAAWGENWLETKG